MSSLSRIIALIVIALGIILAACLLWFRPQERPVSYTTLQVATSSEGTMNPLTVASNMPVASTTSTPKTMPAKYGFATVDGITFEIATSTAKQEQGLSGRATIPDNYAMLFAFPQDSMYGFWMKDMLQPLDMLWLSDNGTIVAITHDATPASYPNVFYPPVSIRYVLETRVGLAAEKGWTIGTRVPLPLPYGA